MKKQLLATLVAGLFATSANAGIQIPAGEWTLDINGNVNAFATITNAHDSNTVTGGLAAKKDTNGESQTQSINTGLLPWKLARSINAFAPFLDDLIKSSELVSP